MSIKQGLLGGLILVLVLSGGYFIGNNIDNWGKVENDVRVEKIVEKQVYVESSAAIDALDTINDSIVAIVKADREDELLLSTSDYKKCFYDRNQCNNLGIILTNDGVLLYGGEYNKESGDASLLAVDSEGKVYQLKFLSEYNGFYLFQLLKNGVLDGEEETQSRLFGFDEAMLGNLDNIEVGQRVLVVIAKMGDYVEMVSGAVSAEVKISEGIVNLDDELENVDIRVDGVGVEVKSAVYYNLAGELIWMKNTAGNSLYADQIKYLLDRYANTKGQEVEHVDLGVSCLDVNSKIAKINNMLVDYGCVVGQSLEKGVLVNSETVESASLAGKIGIKNGDVILSINNKSLLNANIVDLIMSISQGDKFEITVLRNGRTVKLASV